MRTVFLSQPTWIPEENSQGLKLFKRGLEHRGLTPRTIGVTDQPSRSPLDEVIALMKESVGAIILGIPQISVESGTLKGNKIEKPIVLATEWNHIEAALAHALGLPLLVIHDRLVCRGVFDRGAANTFLHCVDFSIDSWSQSDHIDGAVTKWCTQLCPAESPKDVLVKEEPKLKWGCYKFEGREGLFCPACYEGTRSFIPVSRLRGGQYQCPACNATLS